MASAAAGSGRTATNSSRFVMSPVGQKALAIGVGNGCVVLEDSLARKGSAPS